MVLLPLVQIPAIAAPNMDIAVLQQSTVEHAVKMGRARAHPLHHLHHHRLRQLLCRLLVSTTMLPMEKTPVLLLTLATGKLVQLQVKLMHTPI